VIFADPPYDREGQRCWLRKALQALGHGSMLAEDGIFVMEQDAKEPIELVEGWKVVREKKYGGTMLRFLQYPTIQA
jgi:16S rRNA G966 N2-methylase RsmD